MGADALKEMMPNTKGGQFLKETIDAVRYAAGLPFQIASCVFKSMAGPFSRHEEKLADDAVVRAFPDMDISVYKENLDKNTQAQQDTLLKNFRENASDTMVGKLAKKLSVSAMFNMTIPGILDTHPTHEQRTINMQNTQQQLQRKNGL